MVRFPMERAHPLNPSLVLLEIFYVLDHFIKVLLVERSAVISVQLLELLLQAYTKRTQRIMRN